MELPGEDWFHWQRYHLIKRSTKNVIIYNPGESCTVEASSPQMRSRQVLTLPNEYTANINIDTEWDNRHLEIKIEDNDWIALNLCHVDANLREVKSKDPENQCFYVLWRDGEKLLVPTLRDLNRLKIQSACNTSVLNPYFTELMPEFTKETWVNVIRHYLKVGNYMPNWNRVFALSNWGEYAPWICNSDLGEVFSLDRMHLYVKSRPYTGEPRPEWKTTSPNFYPYFPDCYIRLPRYHSTT